MRRSTITSLALAACLLAFLQLPAHQTSARVGSQRWIAAWAAAPQGPFPAGHAFDEPSLKRVFRGAAADDQTLRLIVRCAVGGTRLRIRLSNAFGRRPLVVGAAYVGISAGDAALVPGSNRRLTFHKRSEVVVPAGHQVYSDPLPFRVAAQQNLAVSLYIPFHSAAITWHASAFTTSYSTAQRGGDRAADQTGGPFVYRTTSWFWLDGVDVYTPAAGTVVALGDSITDGWRSTVDKDNRWPDILARRMLALPPARQLSVVDEGIAGNMVVPPRVPCPRCGPPAVARLQRDVLEQAGVRAVILLEGINDIGHGTSAARIIAGMRSIAARVHARGLPIYAATLLPDGGSAYMTPWLCRCNPVTRERTREQVNAFIRTSGVFDGVIDLDALLRDPYDHWRLAPRYDSGDHLHPNPAGLRAIGDAIPLSLLDRRARSQPASRLPRPAATTRPSRS